MRTEHCIYLRTFSSKFLLFIIVLLISLGLSLSAQKQFTRGVNLTNWFQAGSVNEIPFSKYSRQDLQNIKNLGCDVIRLPINLHFMTSGTPDYIIDPLFYHMLDSVVKWAEEVQINLILDNHTFDPAVNTDPGVGPILVKVWSQMAEHYKNSSTLIKYEVLNEPHGITTQVWASIQQTAIDAIRAVDQKHTIVVGAAGWNTYSEMNNLTVYSDTNLIYTFHFYDPFLFTHQGASWTSPSMVDLASVPFPYNPDSMPACPASLLGSWIENELKYNYAANGTVGRVKQLLDIAINFRKTHNVPVFCGEFGVFNQNSNNNERVYWYQAVRTYLEANYIPWTIWDYQGGFGIFNKGSNEIFNHDLNIPLVQALGFNVPVQTVFNERPDSVGFNIYSDYPGPYIFQSNGSTGINYYSDSKPNNGNYCLDWNGGPRYSYIGFDFVPNRDFSTLLLDNYAIDFFVRGDSPGSNFEIRFIDTKTADPNDHPWRMHKQIDESMASWDNKWHHIRISLKDFTEMGSWDNGWYNPVGLFDWTAVDRFDIVAESAALTGKEFWFDNIFISNSDSSRIWDNSALKAELIRATGSQEILRIYPNPARDLITLQYFQKKNGDVVIQLSDITGRKFLISELKNQSAGEHSFILDRRNREFTQLSNGLYVVNVLIGGETCLSGRFILQD